MSGNDYNSMVEKATGYSKAELDAAWELVKPPGHWKDPIDATIGIEHEDVVRAAVEFFTATVPSFRVLSRSEMLLKVEAAGYRAGPAGDH